MMIPPDQIDVRDKHDGFTIETKGRNIGHCTLWRPALVLVNYGYDGTLQTYNENSFYQNHENVTEAVYKVKGYRYPVICWFSETGERIA